MPIPFYWVDAFSDRPFAGNPAGVCPLDAWLDDATMQAIAAENGLAETAFFVADETGEADYHLRWFTPAVEVALCGHATLATGHVVLNLLPGGGGADRVTFRSRSGVLSVSRDGGRLALDFPSWPPAPRAVPEGLGAALGHPSGREPIAWLDAPQEPERDRVMAVFETAEEVRMLAPDMAALRTFPDYSVLATAPGGGTSPEGLRIDFVSRYFAPNHGIDEDPVTGSNHCLLIPYWAERLGKPDLVARQISARGGTLYCRLEGDRVSIGGDAALYMTGEILV